MSISFLPIKQQIPSLDRITLLGTVVVPSGHVGITDASPRTVPGEPFETANNGSCEKKEAVSLF